ncbi:hypothetical protein BCR35DRAFT_38591 [Leucosporidium creatinivorum]|uniref:Arrestin-like N-terminal domain-containing protein n=1 Tax=Leucosporidium creatinivorum TaxID=106004 RepID=A0A1Y2FTY3_9BASI|nr:hypothetical protein BCR35DRAFT_38591 [Leucosporidium creatinivorum]
MPTHSETLPQYSRRAPGATTPQNANLPPQRLHVHISRSKKLELQVKARGEDHVVLSQTEVGGDVWIEGKLVVTLPQPEQISFLRLRVKGVVRTMVMKVHGSGRHPVGDEVVICEDGEDLWTPEMTLLNNESVDPNKLQGTFTFPYRLKIPGRIRSAQGPDPTSPRRTRSTPPSFVLSGNASEGGGKGVEWASCRYYLKVTMGRKGLLKVNERFIVPLVYVPRHSEPEMSAMRTVALAEGRPTPSPQDDPLGWNGQKIRHIVKRGMFAGKRAWYDAALLLPAPATFARLSTVPFAIKLTSSDPSTTTRFPLTSLTAYLVQRTHISAQGLSNAHDSVVAQGTLEEDGPSEGSAVERDREGEVEPAVWEKRFKGSLSLSKAVGSSFRAPNLTVQFLVAIYITVPGAGNDAELVLPIEIVSSSPVVYAARAPRAVPLPPTAAGPIPIPAPSAPVAAEGGGGVGAAALSPDEMGLPPSYFQVLEEEERNR